MAQKRMFDKAIVLHDDFLEMPDSTQNLYFQLNMNADDDGFVDNWKSIMRMTGKKEDDLKLLIAKSYIIPFETGVIVIRHWRINNFLRKDRHTDTKYIKELQCLNVDINQEYSLKEVLVNQWSTSGQPSIEENREEKNNNSTTTISADALEEGPLIVDSGEELLMEEPLVDNLFNYLEKAWGRTLSAYEYELLETWKDNEITRYAIKESVKNNARSIKYVEAIVKSLEAKGIKTEAEAIKESDNFKQRRQKNKSRRTCRVLENEPDWFNQDIETKEVTDEELKAFEERLKHVR